jgi:pullulanase
VSATSTDGRLLAATGLQLPGVLDERYATDTDLGVVWDGDVPSLHLWAPTAKSVTCTCTPPRRPRSRSRACR